jgi:hypothetical protein
MKVASDLTGELLYNVLRKTPNLMIDTSMQCIRSSRRMTIFPSNICTYVKVFVWPANVWFMMAQESKHSSLEGGGGDERRHVPFVTAAPSSSRPL